MTIQSKNDIKGTPNGDDHDAQFDPRPKWPFWIGTGGRFPSESVAAFIGMRTIADGAADNWTFLETLSPETEVIDFWHACEHLQTASDHAVAPGWFEKYREILRHDPRGVAKVIRALRHLRDAAAAPDRAETERELAFFRKHRHRMRYHALKEEGIAIGSGVVEAAN